MRKALWLGFFGWFICQGVFAQEELDLYIANNRFLILKVQVNDGIDSHFILDTGAGVVAVSSKFFARIRQTAEPMGVLTGFRSVGTRIDGEVFRIPNLQIGRFRQRNVAVFPMKELDEAEGIDGMISLKVFENQPFTLDFKGRKLILETAKSLKRIEAQAESIPLIEQLEQGVSLCVFVPLLINDKVRILAEFDTGTGVETLVHPYYLKALGIDPLSEKVKVESFQSTAEDAPQERIIANVASLAVVGSRLVRQTDLPVTFLQRFIYQGLIGWQAFKERKVTFDCARRRLLIR